MADGDDSWAAVHGEISDTQEIERLLFDLSVRYRNKDTDTDEFRASDGWCFGLRVLRSGRVAGDFDMWRHEFEMADFLCDALCIPHGSTFTAHYSEESTISASGRITPIMHGIEIRGFGAMGVELHQARESLEGAYWAALMHNNWS